MTVRAKDESKIYKRGERDVGEANTRFNQIVFPPQEGVGGGVTDPA